MEKFFGGSPAAAIMKIVIASVIVGVILSVLGFNPQNLYIAIMKLGHWLSTLGFDAVETVFRYLALGAVIVVPIWLILRVLSLLGGRPPEK